MSRRFLFGKRKKLKNYMVRAVQLCRNTEILHFQKNKFYSISRIKLFNKKERQKTNMCGLREAQE